MSEIKRHPVYLVDASDEAAMSLVKKLAGNCQPNSIIPLTNAEFRALNRSVVQLSVEDTGNVR